MATINQAWHDANPMPKDATPEQRREWHLAHQKYCGCQPMPESLHAEVLRDKPLTLPKPLDSDLDCD